MVANPSHERLLFLAGYILLYIYIYTFTYIYIYISSYYLPCVYIHFDICIYTSIYGARARISSPKLIGMMSPGHSRHNTCDVCNVFHGSTHMHLDHLVDDQHNWQCNLLLLDRVVFWCVYCNGPVEEPLSQHIVTPRHAAKIHEVVCPWDYEHVANPHPPCAPDKCFVMHREPQMLKTPALMSQCLYLYADNLYMRHMAMHPRYYFGATTARVEGDEPQEAILDVVDSVVIPIAERAEVNEDHYISDYHFTSDEEEAAEEIE